MSSLIIRDANDTINIQTLTPTHEYEYENCIYSCSPTSELKLLYLHPCPSNPAEAGVKRSNPADATHTTNTVQWPTPSRPAWFRNSSMTIAVGSNSSGPSSTRKKEDGKVYTYREENGRPRAKPCQAGRNS